MASSGTYSFGMDLGDILEEAFERAGLELRSGYDYRTGRRSLDLLMLEWQNRGLNLWTIGTQTIDLVAGTSRYQLDAQALDVVEAITRTGSGSNQTDLNLDRISVSRWANLSNKNAAGPPNSYYLERSAGAVYMNLWPVPTNSDADLVVWYMGRIQDSGVPAANEMDLPIRFLPALVAGLAYYIATKRPEVSERAPLLKVVYEEQLLLAEEAHREKASVRFVPGRSF